MGSNPTGYTKLNLKGILLNEQEMLDTMRAEAKERNENLKRAAAERLRKNAEYNKANKSTKRKE